MSPATLFRDLSRSSRDVLDDSRAFEIDALLQQGLPIGVAMKLFESRQVPKDVRPAMLGSSLRTLQRKLAKDTALSPSEGANLIESIRLIDRATEVIGSLAAALKWLQAEIRSLGGRRPMELLNTPIGRREVERILGRIEYGVY